MDERCESYLDDPARFAAHAESCQRCGKLMAELDGIDRALRSDLLPDGRSSFSGPLPMAAWEGARHRSWTAVIVGTLVLMLAAAAAFMIVGIPPLSGFAGVVGAEALTGGDFVSVARAAGNGLRQAPPMILFGLAALFVGINLLLVVMLRRQPRGIDETAR